MRHLCPWNRLCSTAIEEVYRFPNSVRRVDGHLEWDIDSLFAHVKQGIPMERGDAPCLSLHVADKLNEYLSGQLENSAKSSQKVVKLAI